MGLGLGVAYLIDRIDRGAIEPVHALVHGHVLHLRVRVRVRVRARARARARDRVRVRVRVRVRNTRPTPRSSRRPA